MRQRPIGHPNQRRPVHGVLLALCTATLALGLTPATSSAAMAKCGGQTVTIEGNKNDNTLNGTPQRDVIAGYGGDDVIDGLQGKDIICGGAGFDILYGSDGNDVLLGESGDDYLYGDYGALYIANDVMDGGENSPFGGDWVFFVGSSSPQDVGVTVNLEGGTSVGEGQDTLKNLENVYGSEDNDTLIGDDDPNYLVGWGGNDVVWGRDGNDAVDGGSGNDDLFGGGGVWDWIVYFDAPTSVQLDLATRLANIGSDLDELSGFELVVGSDYADTLMGDARPNYLAGRGGDDDLDGRDGFDIGTFYNSANASLDTGSSTGGTSPLQDPLVLPEGNDSLVNLEGLWGSPAVDNLVGDNGHNLFRGGAGNDALSGLGGNDYFLQEGDGDTIAGGSGTYDLVDYTLSPRRVEANLATGSDSAGASVSEVEGLLGSAFNDTLRGDSGTNYLYGQAGNDNLRGKGGDDALAGGKGNDNVSGGPGNDRCIQGEIQLKCELAKPPPPHPLFVVGNTVARAERRYK